MSTSAVLYSVQQQVFRIGGPILIAIGSISALLNLLVLTKDGLRKNPCTICLNAVSIINFFYFYFGLLLTTLAVGYNTDLSAHSLAFCRFRYYIANILACWQFSYLILASIDRTLITSANAGTRKLSTVRFVTITMIVLAIFWSVVQSHIWFFVEILQFGPGYFVCFYQPGLYATIMGYHALTVHGVIPTSLMIFFGLWTVKNVRGLRHRPTHFSRTNGSVSIIVGRAVVLRSKDRQLIRMLLVDITAYIICKFPSTIALMYQQITQYNEKSAEQQVIEQSIIQLTFFWYFVDNGIAFYKNMLVSKTFRAELKRIFLCRP